MWNCPRCTFEHQPKRSVCEACGFLRETLEEVAVLDVEHWRRARVHERTGGQLLVSYVNYPQVYNEWVPANDPARVRSIPAGAEGDVFYQAAAEVEQVVDSRAPTAFIYVTGSDDPDRMVPAGSGGDDDDDDREAYGVRYLA